MSDDKRHLHAVNSTRSNNQRPWWGGWPMLTAAALITGTGVVVTFFLTRALDRRFKNPEPRVFAAPQPQPQVVVIRDDETPRKHPMTSRFEDDEPRKKARDSNDDGDDLRKKVAALEKQMRAQKRRLSELEGEDED